MPIMINAQKKRKGIKFHFLDACYTFFFFFFFFFYYTLSNEQTLTHIYILSFFLSYCLKRK